MLERHEDARLSAFLDDELCDDDALRVTRHLVACDACLGDLERLRLTRDAVRRLPEVEPPAHLFSGLDGGALAAPRAPRLWVGVLAAIGLATTVYLLGLADQRDVLTGLERPSGSVDPTHSPILTPVDLEP